MRFYFTIHPGDMIKGRLLPDAHVMVVASSMWDEEAGKFRIRRPPADHIASLCVDSGGFVAAQRWGEYPWGAREYIEFAQSVSEGHNLDFIATLDYACERGVNRSQHATNRDRIQATVENALACINAAPSLPWLPVVQGWTLPEYDYCIQLYQEAGISLNSAGLGTMCGRKPGAGIRILRALGYRYPQNRWHVFGMHLWILKNPFAAAVVQSWDSYAWNWGKGSKSGACRIQKASTETWSSYCRRLAEDYHNRVQSYIAEPRTLPLWQQFEASQAGDLKGDHGERIWDVA